VHQVGFLYKDVGLYFLRLSLVVQFSTVQILKKIYLLFLFCIRVQRTGMKEHQIPFLEWVQQNTKGRLTVKSDAAES
jgi:hypothetical protein